MISKRRFEEERSSAVLDERINCAAIPQNLKVAQNPSDYFQGWNDACETVHRLIDARNTSATLRATAEQEAREEMLHEREIWDSVAH